MNGKKYLNKVAIFSKENPERSVKRCRDLMEGNRKVHIYVMKTGHIYIYIYLINNGKPYWLAL
jgi:hypothetical protein